MKIAVFQFASSESIEGNLSAIERDLESIAKWSKASCFS